MFKKYQQIHFVGIGGIGMSGIAEVLINLGYRVTGSDLKVSDTTKRLKRLGAKVYKGHNKKNVGGAHVVVTSSAVSGDNPEVREAKRSGIVVVPRAEMLSELMRLKYGVAIAGTHGKTSTTSLVGYVFNKAGLDPTIIIGGKVKSFRSNAKLGRGDFLVAEADESDRSFLKLAPTIGVVTNIDQEHMENYKNFSDMQDAFVEFSNKVPFYGAVVACDAHPVVKRVLKRVTRPCITYGSKDSDYRAEDIVQMNDKIHFNAFYHKEKLGNIKLKMTGSHHVLNALATIAVARHLDIPFKTIKSALGTFSGVKRRFEILSKKGPIVVDDYAHHPVEIAATIEGAKAGWPDRRIVVVLQPHRYSRLADHYDGFIRTMKDADAVVIMDVYSAGEKKHRTYTGEKLWKDVCKKYSKKMVAYAPTTEEVLATLGPWCRKEDLVLFLGAGSVTQTAKSFMKSLTSPRSVRA
ncbi:MAG: UDP-N-acetylmuramate--L-alanine ligase [Deltaproteobacteria bacterium]|nr:UDP-N-acetylmuramate--L-alanine ligase [Deltaproteobacteria bacterium]